MKKIKYSIMALFVLSILFVVGGSSSQSRMEENNITLYSESTITGWDTFEASKMIGSQLRTTEGDYLGQIDDFVFDPRNGRILRVVLSDVQGMGALRVSIPFATVSHTGEYIFVFNQPEEYSGWSYSEAPLSFWTEVGYVYSESEPMETFNAAAAIGAPVQTSEGEDVALVNDLVVDFAEGRVVYAVLSDVGGMEGKMVAVPCSELSISSEDVFALHITKEKLETAPTFVWISIGDREYADNIYRYYGVHPYWEESD